MNTDNKVRVQREISELFNAGNFAVLDELIAEEYTSHHPASPSPIRGREDYGALIAAYRSGFGDQFRVEILDQVAEGDKVATRWRASGRHDGELFGIPATGRAVEITGITNERFRGGKVVEDWVIWDALGLMRQLGVIPEMEPAPASA